MKEKKPDREYTVEELSSIPGFNTICFLCGSTITERDIVKGNLPVVMKNIPGYVHKKCRGRTTVNMINDAQSTAKSVEGMINDII